MISVTGCNGCAILIINGDKIDVISESGFLKNFDGVEFSSSMPAIKYIIESKSGIFTNDLKNSKIASCVPDGCNMNSMICEPVIVADVVKGIIHLDSMKNNAFDEEDLSFVRFIAGEIALALERSLIYEEVKNLSVIDSLTGLFNRRKMEEDLENEILRCERYKREFSVFMIDIDWFKKYNDYHGHQKGDDLLKEIGSIFLKNLRKVDKVYRYGGEEFLVLLPETNKRNAIIVAERLNRIIAQKKFEGEEESQPSGKITISIGLSSYPLDGLRKDEIIKAADSALYRAKSHGRNRICVFNN